MKLLIKHLSPVSCHSVSDGKFTRFTTSQVVYFLMAYSTTLSAASHIDVERTGLTYYE